jgi:hypothetical protein
VRHIVGRRADLTEQMRHALGHAVRRVLGTALSLGGNLVVGKLTAQIVEQADLDVGSAYVDAHKQRTLCLGQFNRQILFRHRQFAQNKKKRASSSPSPAPQQTGQYRSAGRRPQLKVPSRLLDLTGAE